MKDYRAYSVSGNLALARHYAYERHEESERGERTPELRLAYSRTSEGPHEQDRARGFAAAFLLCLAVVLSLGLLAEGVVSLAHALRPEVQTFETHCVECGESLWSIAESCELHTMRTEDVVRLISSHNALSTSLLTPGQHLEIPVTAS